MSQRQAFTQLVGVRASDINEQSSQILVIGMLRRPSEDRIISFRVAPSQVQSAYQLAYAPYLRGAEYEQSY